MTVAKVSVSCPSGGVVDTAMMLPYARRLVGGCSILIHDRLFFGLFGLFTEGSQVTVCKISTVSGGSPVGHILSSL